MNQKHYTEWIEGSGISREMTELNLISTNNSELVLKFLNVSRASCTAGWLVRSIDPFTGKDTAFGQFKPEKAPIIEGKPAKYLTPKGQQHQAIFLKVPGEPNFWQEVLNDPTREIFITEGAKKAAALLQHKKACIALTGVWNGQIKRQRLIPILQQFAKKRRTFYLCFDSDQITNRNVQMALKSQVKLFKQEPGVDCHNVLWSTDTKGLDDYILKYGLEGFESLLAKIKRPKMFIEGTVVPELPNSGGIITKTEDKAPVVQQGSAANNRDDPADNNKLKVPNYILAEELSATLKLSIAFELATNKWYRYNTDCGIWVKTDEIYMDNLIIDFIKWKLGTMEIKTSRIQEIKYFLRLRLYVKELLPSLRGIPFRNGFLSMPEKQFVIYKPEYYVSHQISFDYLPEAVCPLMDKFLGEIFAGKEDIILFIKAIFYLALTQNTSFEKFFEFQGKGGSGKTTLLNILIALLGKKNVHITDLQQLENNRFETSLIKGKSAIIISEVDRFTDKSVMLKRIVGNDLLRSEEKYEQPGEGFYSRSIVFIATNEPIQHSDRTSGIFRRRVVIPFEHTVEPHMRRNILTVSADNTISGELAGELPGFVNQIIKIGSDPEKIRKMLLQSDLVVPNLIPAKKDALSENPTVDFLRTHVLFCNEPDTYVFIGSNINPELSLYGLYLEYSKTAGYKPVALNRFASLILDICNNQLDLHFIKKERSMHGTKLLGVKILPKMNPNSSRDLDYKIVGPGPNVFTQLIEFEGRTGFLIT